MSGIAELVALVDRLQAEARQRRLDAREHLTAAEMARLADWKRTHTHVAA